MNGTRKMRGGARLWVALMALALAITITPPQQAKAASAAGWDAGYIISDIVFYDSHSMSANQIATFLQDKGSGCTDGARPCLKNYSETTRNWAAEPGLCAGYTGRAGETAAQIIARVAESCGISPKVLLTTLQKETSLVTKTQPTVTNYNTAMGYGCPDTAPCATEYYGFFNQVYRAARQFKIYAAYPTRYGYQAGRSNYILYHPNTACGGSNVTIRNQATASLYIYTPYQPNAAALANLYGTGNSCSSYGNRNFWRTFTDWFGDPRLGSYFIKSASAATSYLVVGTVKYRVPDLATYYRYKPLGAIVTVSDAQLNSYPTAGTLGQFVRNAATGEVFFADGGLNHMPTCTMVTQYGGNCSSLINLDAAQLALMTRGPEMANVAKLLGPGGRTYAVLNGRRHEVFDDTSRKEAGLAATTTTLTASALDYLPLGAPIIRDRVVATGRSGKAVVWVSGRAAPIDPVTANAPGLASLPHGQLDTTSIAALPSAGGTPGVFSRDGQGTALLSGTGLVVLDAAVLGSAKLPASSVPAAFFDSIPQSKPVGPIAVTAQSTSKVFVYAGGQIRWARNPADLLNRFGGRNPGYTWIGPETLNALPVGPDVLPAGAMVKAQNNADVFLVDAGTRLVWVDQSATLTAFGTWTITTVPAAALSGYQVDATPLQPLITCPDTRAGVDGARRPINLSQASPVPTTSLGSAACSTTLSASGTTVPGPLFVTSPAARPVIYVVTSGVKQPIGDVNVLIRLRGSNNAPIFSLSDSVLQQMPTGPMVW